MSNRNTFRLAALVFALVAVESIWHHGWNPVGVAFGLLAMVNFVRDPNGNIWANIRTARGLFGALISSIALILIAYDLYHLLRT
jgi:hypothetical protein